MNDTQSSTRSASPQPAEPLPAEATDFFIQSGESLASLADDTPVLLVFLRHLGCAFCREAVADMAQDRQAIRRQGVRLVLGGMSDTRRLREFAAIQGLRGVDVISDPERRLYRAFQLRRGTLKQLFGPEVWVRGFEAFRAGHGIGALEGDGLQMPGAFLIHQGRILRAYRHRAAGDRPDYAALAQCSWPAQAPREPHPSTSAVHFDPRTAAGAAT